MEQAQYQTTAWEYSIQTNKQTITYTPESTKIILNNKQKYAAKEKNLFSKDSTAFISDIKTKNLPKYYKENQQKLKKIFDKELEKYEGSLGLTSIQVTFNLMSKYFSELPFTSAVMEITPSETLKFTLLFPEKKILMVKKPIENSKTHMEYNEIIFTFFINREMILSDAFEIQDFVDKFSLYLSM